MQATTAHDLSSATDVLRAEKLTGPYYGLRPISAALFDSLAPSGGEEILARIATRKNELTLEILTLNAFLNANVKINCIPPELLGEIFLFVNSSSAGFSAVVPLLMVCRHWFVVGATTPRLWTSVLVSYGSTEGLRTALARSKSCPFTVTVLSRMAPTLLELLTPHVHRLRAVSSGVVHGEFEPQLLRFLHNHTMPMLEAFSAFVNHPDESSSNLIEFPLERFPRLTSLGLYSLQTDPSSPIFRQLTRLHLSGRLGPSFSSLHLGQMLRNCISLDHLRINHVLLSDNGELVYATTVEERVTLAKMKDISVDANALLIHQVLYAVIIPATACVHLCRSNPHDLPLDTDVALDGIRGVLPLDCRSSLPILEHVVSVTAKMTFDEHELHCTVVPPGVDGEDPVQTSPSITLAVDMHSSAGYGDLNGSGELLDMFSGSSKLERLNLEIEKDKIFHINWRIVLTAFPKLKILSVLSEGRGAYVSRLFAALRPDADPDGTVDEERVLCPLLEDVRCWGVTSSGCHPEKIAECLERRRTHLGREKALKSLTISVQRETSVTLDVIEEVLEPLVDDICIMLMELVSDSETNDY
ncbi:hypothetical protein C8Q80DRAFT_255112 [Daedaleopsis nitida]|nr:hypothetical protein C8Q80DRAFT_255112 [Daedaleopsis nitida]